MFDYEWKKEKIISDEKGRAITALAAVAFIFLRQLLKLWDHCLGFYSSLLRACIFFSRTQTGSFGRYCCLECENGVHLLQLGWALDSSGREWCSDCCLGCCCFPGHTRAGLLKQSLYLQSFLKCMSEISLLLTRERLCLVYFIIPCFYF